MNLGEEINVTDKLYNFLFSPAEPARNAWGDWFILHFTENNGMAFGMEFAGEYGKLILSLFRILAVFGITYYIWTLVQKKANRGLIISISLILAGALGNILDSAFYGIIFSDSFSYYGAPHAQLFPADGGYANFLHGRVVDMLYFPVVETRFPDWFPFWGGEDFLFFRPVFNIADSAITVGVGMIVLFQRRYFAQPEELIAENETKLNENVPVSEDSAPETATDTRPESTPVNKDLSAKAPDPSEDRPPTKEAKQP